LAASLRGRPIARHPCSLSRALIYARRADGLLYEGDHFGSAICSRYVLHDLAVFDNQSVQQRGQQLPAGIRNAALQ